MHTMLVTLEWNEDLGPRWLNKANLMSQLSLKGNSTDTLRVKSVVFPDSTAKERAQDEFQQLCCRMDRLGSMSYKKFMALEVECRLALERQYESMDEYRQALLARIEAWTDES